MPSRLVNLYKGAALTSPVSRLAGGVAASSASRYSIQRTQLLSKAVQEGKVTPSQLSKGDQALIKKKGGGHGFLGFGKGLEVLGNLGEDIVETGKGIPGGIKATASAIWADLDKPVGDVVSGKKGTHVRPEIIDPAIAGYKYTYLGKGAPEGSTLWDRLAEHPLSPILDLATIASGGAAGVVKGGALAGKAGIISSEGRLANLGAIEGRSSLQMGRVTTDADVDSPIIERDYSARPLRKGLEIMVDSAGDMDNRFGRGIYNFQASRAMRRDARENFTNLQLESATAEYPFVKRMKEALRGLSPKEIEAGILHMRGLRDPESLDAYEAMVQESLDAEKAGGDGVRDEDGKLIKDEEGNVEKTDLNYKNFAGKVPRELLESRAKIPDEVRELAQNPGLSPKVVGFIEAWQKEVAEGVARLREEGFDLPQEALDAKARQSLEQVHGRELTPDELPEDLTYVPDLVAENYKLQKPGVAGKLRGREEGFVQGRNAGEEVPKAKDPKLLLVDGSMGSLKHSSGSTFKAGVTRADGHMFIEHLSERENLLKQKSFNKDTIEDVGMRREDGKLQRAANQAEAEGLYGPDWTVVHTEFPMQFFSQLVKLEKEWDGDVPDDVMAEGAKELMDGTVRSFNKLDGVVVPKKWLNYQFRVMNSTRAFDNKFMRLYARAMHRWRTLTLAYMPRWAINTAIGSFFINTLKGVGPRAYFEARKMGGRGMINSILKPNESHGAFDEIAGVNLGKGGDRDLREMRELGFVGHQAGMKAHGPLGERFATSVQAIEDYYRRASFVHSLDKEGKRAMWAEGDVLKTFSRRIGVKNYDEYIGELLKDEKAMGRTMRDLNKFSYNFSVLGPFERKYVRQFVPFWGWYKFISKLAYRLPLEYPGRTNVLAQMGMIGIYYEDELGPIPDWLRGVIPLSVDKDGKLTYFSTMGLNPFAQFANPLSEEGVIAGSMQLGQASPLIQAALSSLGLDPMRGGMVGISSDSGITTNRFGEWIDPETGETKSPMQEGALRRLLGGLIRSVPQARMAERALVDGNNVYPESIPIVSQRPMPAGDKQGLGLEDLILNTTGIGTKSFKLGSYQEIREADRKAAAKKIVKDQARLKKKLSGKQ